MVTFAGCQKEENNAPASQTKTVEFFANSIETKTHFADKTADNKYPTLWDAGDKVKVLMNLESIQGVSGLEKVSDALTASDISNNSASARFKVELNTTHQSDSYTYYAVVPSSAYNAKSNADGGRVTVIIPADQTPQPNALDKAAQIIYAVSETYPSIQDAVSLDFKHFTAYGKFSLTNLTNQIGTIKTVALKFDGVNIAGKWNYYPSTDTKGVHEAGSNTITLTTSSATDIWFACAPVDVSGKKLTVTVTDVDGKQLVREVTMPTDRVFESGKVSNFTVNMKDIVPPAPEETSAYYVKVTEALSDWSGTYLIVFDDNKAHATVSGKDFNATSNTLTISNGKIAATDDANKAAVVISKNGAGYNILLPSSNYLKVSSSSTISSTSAVASYISFVANSTQKGSIRISGDANFNTGSYILYHQSSYFRCYTNKLSTSNYYLPDLYRLEKGGETPGQPETPATPVLSVTATEVNVAAAAGNGEITYSVENSVSGTTVSASTTATWITNFSYTTAGKVTFSVSANTGVERSAVVTLTYPGAAESKNVTVKQAAGQGGGESTTSVTVTKSISSYGFTNEQKVTEIKLDDVVTAKLSGGSNTGKYYTNGSNWRLYQTENASITISVSSEYTIKSVKVTYSNSNNGVLMKNSTEVSSGTTDTVNANSVTYKVGNTGSATNGQVRITAIEVVYQK